MVSNGYRRNGSLPAARDPLAALEQIDKMDGNIASLFVLKDFHDFWTNAQVRRKLRSLSQQMKFTKKSILIITPSSRIPDELKDEVVLETVPLPDAERASGGAGPSDQNLRGADQPDPAWEGKTGQGSRWADRLPGAARLCEGHRPQRNAGRYRYRPGDRRKKTDHPRERSAGILSRSPKSLDNVGGLKVLKEWLRLRDSAFSDRARDYGLPMPKGIALLGIPGTGKSLTAKMIGGLWRMPLLRLDVGALFGSLVGESEERTRRALHLAETIAPCVLWIDEMEKALAHGGLDSGTSTRVFGTVLTWMQEKKAPVFVVATANDISSLPPELLRKGRFDEIFFLDLPTVEERKEIFAVHLRKRRRLPQDFDLECPGRRIGRVMWARKSNRPSSMPCTIGFNDNEREFTTAGYPQGAGPQVPLSVSQREVINLSARMAARRPRSIRLLPGSAGSRRSVRAAGNWPSKVISLAFIYCQAGFRFLKFL